MAKKERVKEIINSIKDNGKNSASTVRSVLNSIVDYAEPAEPIEGSNDLQTFEFSGKSIYKVSARGFNEKVGVSDLTFSIRGIKNLFVNITFLINILGDYFVNTGSNHEKMIFDIEGNDELFHLISPIISKTDPKLQPTFLLNIQNNGESDKYPNLFKIVSFTIDFNEAKKQIIFNFSKFTPNSPIFNSKDFATTSFSIHVS